ncbi:MAG: aldehyde dehydrogenase family protein [Candidatus Hydrogenedens sp.]|jgi:acyl-CoA reductase-like NAD-dependent aldehyde dehydrogenase|nr:aldehyde dehydrogenase family protein [Candidatus Hydrogenedens sp.]
MSENAAETTDRIEVHNPKTGEVLYAVSEYSETEIAAVYQRAGAAQTLLAAMTVAERVEETQKLKNYLRDNMEEVCQKIIRETGKSRTDALLAEIYPILDMLDYYAKNAVSFLADEKVRIPVVMLGPGMVNSVKDFFGKKAKIVYEPLGTVLVIAPWNYPFHLSFFPAISAFLAGNAVIIKPSTQTPLQGLYEEMIEKSGFMKDAIQCVYGSRKTGEGLIDARPAKIFFTGSVSGGRHVMSQAAKYLIPVELELGGKDPMIVFEDVDLERATSGALWGGMLNCGQTCTSVERIFVQETVLDDFVSMLKEKMAKISTMSELSEDEGDLCVGCMTTVFQIEEIEAQLEDARAKGAEIVAGGSRVPDTFIFPPTLVVSRDLSLTVLKEETFGPVMTVAPFKTEEDAIRLANDSPFGLNSSVWSKDLVKAERVARALVTGNVSINNVLATQTNAALPFGGVKDSGMGRYHGPFGLHSFSNIKSMTLEKSSDRREINWYPYTKEKFQLLEKLFKTLYSGHPLALLRAGLLGNKLAALVKKQKL